MCKVELREIVTNSREIPWEWNSWEWLVVSFVSFGMIDDTTVPRPRQRLRKRDCAKAGKTQRPYRDYRRKDVLFDSKLFYPL